MSDEQTKYERSLKYKDKMRRKRNPVFKYMRTRKEFEEKTLKSPKLDYKRKKINLEKELEDCDEE